MKKINGAPAPTESACPQNSRAALLCIVIPGNERPIFGPFLNIQVAELMLKILRIPNAKIATWPTIRLDDMTYRQAQFVSRTVTNFVEIQGAARSHD
ncbi:TPA: hypothetical protein SL203_003117 [Pseudomonas aeruginosa]|uniref:hypothetical protein n=1 Tax=Pseudomonas aeruginosa TaxID=287 RepID=UPI001067272A|nr:hypothetical protein [Pseudomonas aeruginosa]EMC9463216.1 hypothetical protein [Pseudomonas aeruginosa]MCS9014595.1 hypothetical protein [Pseudomonas aeruginosa]TED73290.1 hypothetical protein IPC1514_14545 [Pseudomonas aeruginosa]HEJ2559260.1 hypothetical protein [Pseudomonas aeruginosa]